MDLQLSTVRKKTCHKSAILIIGCCIVITLISLYSAFLSAAWPSHTENIKNPYFSQPLWKLWREDDTPAWLGLQILKSTPKEKRLYPVQNASDSDSFLTFQKKSFFNKELAGMWDDVYLSLDNHHSYIRHVWGKRPNRIDFKNQFMHMTTKPGHQHGQGYADFWTLGVNFTSQSTTHMGHDLTDSYEDIEMLERNFYFTNSLRAGPAHNSYHDKRQDRISDQYDAIVPVFFNSVGSSRSEVPALSKLMIAGSYLPAISKAELKRHGLYIATLLYIWKASLPYEVPYQHELRHRVAYAATGEPTDKNPINRQVKYNHTYHLYDETLHLKNMVRLAESMDALPPIALLKLMDVQGGKNKSANKSTIRIYQHKGESVKIRVTVNDSYDLQGQPLTFAWTSLQHNVKMDVQHTEKAGEYLITIPFDPQLPKGRSTLLLTANNGHFDSNPATINIFRDFGENNLRPSIHLADKHTVKPGTTFEMPLISIDPEGFPVRFYQWSGEVGKVQGDRFIWHVPLNATPNTHTVSIIASDGTGSFNSKQIQLIVAKR
ncbi:MAG: hypothetical protein JKY93_09500 [Gammaproteobacteria bacterium]|nr:hypothetical protein [Gammaproteobacteria bacterium]